MSTNQATVETLTAEVRVLTVGNRQITQSVAKQLDAVPYGQIKPFGRIRFTGDENGTVRVIGADNTGTLVKSSVLDRGDDYIAGLVEQCRVLIRKAKLTKDPYHVDLLEKLDAKISYEVGQQERADEWRSLPLIVLAGLR